MGFPKNERLTHKILWELNNNDADFSDATGTLAIFSVPAGCVIHSVRANVITAVTGATSEIVGDGSDTNGYIVDGFAAATGVFPLCAQDAATTFVGAYQFNQVAGATDAADVTNVPTGKLYASADTIDFIIGGTATAGKIEFIIEFTRVGT